MMFPNSDFILNFFFIFKVIAYDVSNSTNEREGGNMTVNINIFDINDNTPKFVEPHGYTFSGDNLGIVGQVI